jgi:beta-lactam-binding protein with PASTA domain
VTLSTPWTIAVPDLTGATLDEATGKLEAAAAELVDRLGLPPRLAGLTLGAVGERVDPATVGTIVEQVPAAGATAWLYGTVDVVVVSPVAGAPVPAILGLTQSAAVASLSVAGFSAGTVAQRPSDDTPGTVVEQAPAAGLAWSRGDRVGMTLAAARTVSVPDVTGYALDAATEVIIGIGLTLGQTTATVEQGPPTIVLGQDPDARSVVPLGTAVALEVRAGVPNVLGLTEADARTTLQAAGVQLAGESTQEVPGPVGIVLSQTPAPGTAVTATTAVSLVLSIAPRVDVPLVVGESVADAKSALDALGLALEVTANEESDSPEGSILSQTPPQGTRVDRGTTVGVVIAVARPKMAAVPNIIGFNLDNAKSAVTNAGFVLAIVGQRPVPGTAAGIVLDQTPAAGTSLVVGSTVSVNVSAMDTSVAVPDVRQQTVQNAQAALAQANLGLSQSGSQQSTQPAGIILSQSPVAGSRVPAGSVVSVIVSVGGLAVVPNLIGRTQASASSLLHSLGLGFSGDVEVNLSVPAGTIFLQDPDAGTTVALGAIVEATSSTHQIRPPGNGLPKIVTP